MSKNNVREIDKIHDTLVDLLCSVMEYIPYEKPEIGDWCYEITSLKNENRDCRIGILKEILNDGRFVTATIGGMEISWTNADFKKIPSNWLRESNDCEIL